MDFVLKSTSHSPNRVAVFRLITTAHPVIERYMSIVNLFVE
jgi:hypothetical protein